MAIYAVYQLDRNNLDRHSWLSVMRDYHEDGWLDTVHMFLKAGKYQHVAIINGKNLDEVFEIGNIGPEYRIVREKDRQMHSVSIGDLIGNVDNGKMFVVAVTGFVQVF